MGITIDNPQTSSPSALTHFAFSAVPLGGVLPRGWLLDQLKIQANGLTGHLDEFWPSVANSRWIGGDHEGWERAPYWLDGLVPLAVLLGDKPLVDKATRWIDYILETQHSDGWLGPKNDPHEGTGEVFLDPWPQFILFKAFTQWQEATGDVRIVPSMMAAMRRIDELLNEKPLLSWGRMRWADLVLSIHWLYERTGEAWLLELASKVKDQGYDWSGHFKNFKHTERTDPKWIAQATDDECLPLHGVNNAMGIKSGAVWSVQSGSTVDVQASLRAVDILDRYHGQVTGMFSGDEHLAGVNPTQGTETCTVVEYMFTLEQMLRISGDSALGDRLEAIAYNALPASMTKDMWGRQYDQQPNQVMCSIARRNWVSNGPYANIFSLDGNFGCCTANLHQGWPKFVSSLWMRSVIDNGVVAAAYAPCALDVDVDGRQVRIEEETNYPFQDRIEFKINTQESARFRLYLRIPAWADDASVSVNGELIEKPAAGGFACVTREWVDGDLVALTLPMKLKVDRRYNEAASFKRGPLVLALSIGTEFRDLGGEALSRNWELLPTTPWNYALGIDDVDMSFRTSLAPPSNIPFDPSAPPVSIQTGGCLVPEWGIENDSAGSPPASIRRDGPKQTVNLVPYGSTYLRISEFPVVTETD